ncbi:MAG: FGGY family carbohydrate kinase [Verrucomicrobiota bacterium JB023]|nr:FGGY family carbohydrate kinase [Verrucomicrobiota bacterium JB023]
MYFLGIDTSARRTLVVALDLELASVVAHSSVEHNWLGGLPEGHVEQDPAGWISAVDQGVRECVAKLGPAGRERVTGIGVSGQPGGTVVLDAKNRILRSAKLASDKSHMSDAEELASHFGGPPGLIELAGNALNAGSPAAFLMGFKKQQPEKFAEIAAVLLPHDFINYWLTGVKRMEYGDASGTGLMDVRTRSWCREIVEAIDPRLHECLPPVCSSRGSQGPLRPDLADSWNLPRNVLVSAGSGQAMLEAIGAGNVDAGGVTVTLGPTGRVSAVSDAPLIDPRGEVGAFCDSTDKWMPMVVTEGATDPLEMVSRTFSWDPVKLEMAVREGELGAGGLMFLPQIDAGDGSGPSAFLHGMKRGNYTSVNLARAATEGVALEFGHGLQRIVELGFEPRQVHVAGDWSRSAVWRQMVSDVLGLPVAAAKGGDGAALGAALQAAVAFFSESGEDLTYQEIAAYAAEPAEGSGCEPDEEAHEHYQEILSRRQYLAESLRGSGLL